MNGIMRSRQSKEQGDKAMEKWVLFDLDGTLTKSEEGIWNCVRYTMKELGYPEPDADTLRKFIGPPIMDSFTRSLGLTEAEACYAVEVYRGRYAAKGLYENRVYPGIRKMLRMLCSAGYHSAVVTGKPAAPTTRILDYFGLSGFFERVTCATDDCPEKEHLIRETLPGGQVEAWMVGDRCYDMEGGKKAGIHTIGVTWGYGPEEELRSSGAETLAFTPDDVTQILCPGVPVPPGAFLSIEGLDGSGKGTQIERLTDAMDRFGFEVVHSREPGGSPIGEKIREILLDRENTAMSDVTEALLYAASRAQHIREIIRPAVLAGKVILCDRFVDSSVAYQGGGRGLGVDRVLDINAPAVDGMMPMLTVYLDIDHRLSLERRCAASEPDRLEMEADAFHARVEEAYHELIGRNPERFVVVDATQDRDTIAGQIAERVLAKLMEAEK